MEGILKSIKSELSTKFISKISKFILVGSRISSSYRNDADFDVVIIVDDDINIYELIQQMSSYIYDISIHFNASIGIYPISKKNYIKGNSQFIDNVILNGIEF